MKSKLIVPIVALAIITSCQNTKKESDNVVVTDTAKNQKIETKDSTTVSDYQKETTDEKTAEKIKAFLVKKLEKDLPAMTKEDRKFSFYAIDLNDDKKDEYFISLEGRYFCGTGGCSFYLLNNDFSVNTYFSVTDAPIFRSSQKTEGWHDLILLGDRDEKNGTKNFIHLKFNKSKGQYPSNPSLIKKTEIAPSGEDFVMWDTQFSKAKTFTF